MSASKRSLMSVSLLLSCLLGVGVSPTQAAGESWVVKSLNEVGCESNDWNLTMAFSGVVDSTYTAHTTVVAGGKVYMNEAVEAPSSGADQEWGLYSDFSAGVVANPGSYPIPSGQQMTVTFSLERPDGQVVSSWSMLAESCDQSTLLVNGPDLDQDLLVDGADPCPGQGATATGCPPRDRSLTLRGRYGPKRVVGKLYAAGYPALYAQRPVTIWKVRPGPDRKIATRTTNGVGKFRARLGKGRYYATSPGLIAATSGETAADTSNRVRVR